ncbi:WD40/YVTN/BNR-like repeat-containing protein [Tahibacter amnicola]|uniref:Exo-alpha-sialidase n=1 Tax=Tahibacter amnicola TaxID=2976241 RepID=A0ABY6BGW3_9GAMM|nr:hypothetical protein [Tahibacter amnicola]UXI67615.1 hypothetical protein N4264_23215 [Tahibacter amnicola]
MSRPVPLSRLIWLALSLGSLSLAGCQSTQTRSLARQEHEEEANESGSKATTPPKGDFWAMRVAYPTGRFEHTWLAEAAQQEKQLVSGIPAGEFAQRRAGVSPLALNPHAFTLLGPKPLNDSEWGWGHVAGRTNVLVVDPVDTTIAYLGSDGGGVWKSTNCCSAATTWTIKTDLPEIASTAIGDLTIDPNNHNTVYAGTGDLRFGSFSFGTAGVLKSTDAGETWSVLGADVFTPFYTPSAGGHPQYQAIGKVAVDPNNSQKLAVGTKTGVYFSYDAGANWSGPCFTNAFTSGGTAQRQDITGLLAINNAGSTTLLAAVGTRGLATPVQPDLAKNGANGVYRTAMPSSGCPAVGDWTLSNNNWPAGTGNGTPTTTLGRIELASAPSNPQIVYAMAAHSTNRNVFGVWKSTDAGLTWTRTVDADAEFTGCSASGQQMWYDAGLSVSPTDPNIVFASAVDLFRSTNGGDTFTNVTCGYNGGSTHVDHHARAFVGNDHNRMLVGSDGGVYYTANAQAPTPTLTPINDSLSTIEFYSGDITANFANSATPGASGGAQDNGSSAVLFGGDPGVRQWESTYSGDGTFTRIEPVNAQRWYYQAQNGALVMSTTGPFGGIVSASGAWSSDRKSFLMPLEIYKHGDTAVANSGCVTGTVGCGRMLAGTYRLWETLSGAQPTSSWQAKTGDLTKNTLILGSDNRSFINQMAYSFTDPTIAVVGTSDGNVQYVFNLGVAGANNALAVNVTAANAVLPNRPVMDVVTDGQNPLVAFAALGGFDQNTPSTPGHVYRVTCTAQCASFTWENKSGNLPNIPVNAIMVNPNVPGQVFAGTDWGLYFTNDISVAAPVWQRFETLPHAMIWDLVVDRGLTTLAVFTRSRGAWAWPLPIAPITDTIFANGFE